MPSPFRDPIELYFYPNQRAEIRWLFRTGSVLEDG